MPVNLKKVEDTWLEYLTKYGHSNNIKVNQIVVDETIINCLSMLGFTRLVEEIKTIWMKN